MPEHAKKLQDDLLNSYGGAVDRRPAAVGVLSRLALHLAPICESNFLTEYAFAMRKALNADHFMIGRLNPYSNIMRTVRYVVGENMSENFTYSLDGTPCARAIEGDTCIHADNVADCFPRDRQLRELNIRGYAGAALVSASGEPLGIVVALCEQPIADPAFARVLIDFFRARIAATLEMSEIFDRYTWAISEGADGLWDWDVLTGGTTISRALQSMLGYEDGEGPYDLMQIENAVHKEDRSTHVEALKNHLNLGAPYDVKVRMRDRTGVYRWFRSRGKAIRNAEGKPIRMIGCLSDIHDLIVEAQRQRG